VLVGVGVGMTIGNVIGGWAADKNLKLALTVGFVGLIAALVAYALLVDSLVGIFATTFLLGLVSSMIGPSVQSRLMEVAGESQVIGAALNHSSMNLGNSAGAYLGGAVIAAGFGFAAPGWVGVALALAGVVLTVVSFRLQKTGDARQAALCAAARQADHKEDTDTGSVFIGQR
jgi:DHA1 family inner membrane transport protein